MTAKLDKSIKRELELDGKTYTITIAPDGVKVTERARSLVAHDHQRRRFAARRVEGVARRDLEPVARRRSCGRVRASLRASATCDMRHCAGALSGRQRRNLVPWRNRPLVKWSYSTSTTSTGSTASHSLDRVVLHRLGPPGARPVNPEPPLIASTFAVIAARSSARKLDVNPTWWRRPSSSYSPSSNDPTTRPRVA